MGWQAAIEELRERERQAQQMGGPDKVKRQHDNGKLTVRERIDALLDKGSFHEIGAALGSCSTTMRSSVCGPCERPCCRLRPPRSTTSSSCVNGCACRSQCAS